ncbi:hypothetical protein C2845_PM04G33090 [Panicum miliaceum]|uniref:Uncharacterized protein n=1 Tax=Panicum miliaceum TaxID=4540 RepID=A0A3L6QWF7_PANMI|nr:hypothetical protein C2845_PM04G33090 [Panicum miliaceum]
MTKCKGEKSSGRIINGPSYEYRSISLAKLCPDSNHVPSLILQSSVMLISSLFLFPFYTSTNSELQLFWNPNSNQPTPPSKQLSSLKPDCLTAQCYKGIPGPLLRARATSSAMARKDETHPPSIAHTISARDTSVLHGTINNCRRDRVRSNGNASPSANMRQRDGYRWKIMISWSA